MLVEATDAPENRFIWMFNAHHSDTAVDQFPMKLKALHFCEFDSAFWFTNRFGDNEQEIS